MIKSTKTILLIPVIGMFIVTGLYLPVQAQPAIDDIPASFQRYVETHYQEKVYLHTDREVYLTGETIWFKVHCLDGSCQKPSDLSKIVYVELIKDSVEDVAHAIIALENGNGSGSLYLPTTLNSGNYSLRAYTRWMKNFDETFFYHCTLSIINPFKTLGLTSPSRDPMINVEFFPEGGTLVAGRSCRVAFEITNRYGKGLNYHGWLTDRAGRKILEFSPTHAGTGSFNLMPVAMEKYTAHVTEPDGAEHEFQFPEISAKGLSLRVKPGGRQLRVEVFSTENDEGAKLFVHSHMKIQAFANLRFTNGRALFSMDKSGLPPGITHITLFDPRGRPAAERLVFVQPEKLLKIAVSTDQPAYGFREKIRLGIKTGISNRPVAANLSVSVFRFDDHLAGKEDNIVSYLLLTSDLKGRIEDPRYYLSGDPQRAVALDNLMLTHGWRRFEWQDLLRPEPATPREIPDFRHMVISGTLKNSTTGKPVSDTLVYLSNPGKFLQTYVSRSDSLGRIYFELKNFYGNRQTIFQTQFKPPEGYELSIDPVFSLQPVTTPALPLQIGKDWETILKKLSISMQIRNAYHEVTRDLTAGPADTTLFYGHPDERYFLDDYTRFPVMEEVMREYIHGVLVRRHQGHFRFMVIDPENDNIFQEPPFILLDGVPVFDTDRIMHYDPKKVKRIDVVTNKYFLGKKVCQGIVNYTTYKGNLEGFDISDADLVMFIDGLQAKRTFYSPGYPDKNAADSRIPDYRNLLYWDPDRTTGTSGTSNIEFYSSDEPGIYKIVVEGITDQGIPGYGEAFIEIKGEK